MRLVAAGLEASRGFVWLLTHLSTFMTACMSASSSKDEQKGKNGDKLVSADLQADAFVLTC